jgi:hypothetical protein
MNEDNSLPKRSINVENSAVGVESVSIMTRYEVSIFAYNSAKSFVEDCRTYKELCDKAEGKQEKMGHLLNEMQRSMMCFVFCVICLEAYINTYAGDRLSELGFSELVWREKLERILPLWEKWTIVPALVLKKTFETDKEPYKSLKWLIDQRNFIVHYKGKLSEPEMNDRLGIRTDRIFNLFSLKEAERAFQLVKDLIKTLHSFDNSKTPNWLV